jgi:hypothetical protein
MHPGLALLIALPAALLALAAEAQAGEGGVWKWLFSRRKPETAGADGKEGK